MLRQVEVVDCVVLAILVTLEFTFVVKMMGTFRKILTAPHPLVYSTPHLVLELTRTMHNVWLNYIV
jgi:hypothetical protein